MQVTVMKKWVHILFLSDHRNISAFVFFSAPKEGKILDRKSVV